MVEQRLKQIISDYTGLNVDSIDTSMSLHTEIELDSFALISLLCEIEDAFGVYIPDSEMVNFQTLADIVDYINTHSQNEAS